MVFSGMLLNTNKNITPSDILVNPVLDSMPTALHRYDFATNETSLNNSTITLQDSTTADVIDLTNSPDTNVILSETTGIQATNLSSNPSSVGTSIRMQTIAGGLSLTDGRKVSFETYFKGIEASGDNGNTDNIFSFYNSDGTAQGIALHIDGIGSIGRIGLSLEGFGGIGFSSFFNVPPSYQSDDPGFERNPSMPGFRHIVVTIDSSQVSSQQVRIYVDGVQASPTAFLTITQNTLFSGVELTPFVNRRITKPNSSAVPLTTARGNTQVKYVRVFDGVLQQTQINEMFSKRENVGTP